MQLLRNVSFYKVTRAGAANGTFSSFLFLDKPKPNQTKPPPASSHAVGKYKTCPLFWENAGAVARVRTQERRGAGSQLLGPYSLQTAQPCVLAPSCKTKDRKLGELHMPSRGLLSRKDKNHLCGVCVLANS